MGKNQRQVSLPRPWLDELEEYYKENKEAFAKINISSYTELLRVLANFGRPRLEKLLSDIIAETASLNVSTHETTEESDTTHKD